MLRRVLSEHRRFLVVLAAVFAVDVAVYALLVNPLASRVADGGSRAAAADRARREAARDLAAAEAVATGKNRAQADLQTFYEQVLPTDISAASRATYLSLAQLARKTNLRIVRRDAAPEHVRESHLDRLRMGLMLEGNYEDIRRFIYELETTPTFVVIDGLGIEGSRQAAKGLALSLSLSTYYRSSDHAS